MKAATALVMALLGTAAHADADERIPVFNTQLDGTVKLETVRLPLAPAPWMNYVCIREFDASAIRCYLIDGDSMRVKTLDLPLKN